MDIETGLPYALPADNAQTEGEDMIQRKRGRVRLPQDKKQAALVVIMPPADIDLLTAEAQRRGMSRSELVRGMLERGGMAEIRAQNEEAKK